MFGAVMSDENNCRRLLELILQFPIERVVVSKEKSMIYHPEYKGVRLKKVLPQRFSNMQKGEEQESVFYRIFRYGNCKYYCNFPAGNCPELVN